jgi:hypothetical protein
MSEMEKDLILLEIISQKFKEQLELVVHLASTSSNQSSHDYESKRSFLKNIVDLQDEHDLLNYVLNDSTTDVIGEDDLNYTSSIENAKKSLEKVFQHLLHELTSKFERLAEILRKIRVNSEETKLVEIKLEKKENETTTKENCNRCEQKFNTLNELVIHARSHKNDRFKCDKCDTYVHPTYGKGQCVHTGF